MFRAGTAPVPKQHNMIPYKLRKCRCRIRYQFRMATGRLTTHMNDGRDRWLPAQVDPTRGTPVFCTQMVSLVKMSPDQDEVRIVLTTPNGVIFSNEVQEALKELVNMLREESSDIEISRPDPMRRYECNLRRSGAHLYRDEGGGQPDRSRHR